MSLSPPPLVCNHCNTQIHTDNPKIAVMCGCTNRATLVIKGDGSDFRALAMATEEIEFIE